MAESPEKVVVNVGNRLSQSRLNKDTLVKLLKQASNALSELKQSSSLQSTLGPLNKSLVQNNLLHHKDKDVRLLMAVCISEIIRVLAPSPPFSDQVFKDIFKLIIGTFADLADIASPYFARGVKILETIDALRCCVLMLDIGCEGLVLEMFRVFFSNIREDHQENVFNAMLSIMTLIINEKVSPSFVETILQNLLKDEKRMEDVMVVNEKLIIDCLNDISRELLRSDVHFDTIHKMQANICRAVKVQIADSNWSKHRLFRQAIYDELCKLLDSGKPSHTPKKGETSVIMFVGLQGSSKTMACTKYANFYKRKGWKPVLVSAATVRGSFDQLKQNAAKTNHKTLDPARIASEGIKFFKQENRDLIILDTNEHHKQEAALFEEMRQVFEAAVPDLVVFVIDGSIGQAAFDQAFAFKQSFSVGAVVISNLDGHSKGGGALDAVAATKSPIIFIETGDKMDCFREFDVKSFVSVLMGTGDLQGIMGKFYEATRARQTDLLLRPHTFHLLSKIYQGILEMGPLDKLHSRIPGFRSALMTQLTSEKEKK